MRRVQFPLVTAGLMIVYPDAIGLFANSDKQGDMVVADYSGALPLDDYVTPSRFAPLTKLSFRRLFSVPEQRRLDKLRARLEDDAAVLALCPGIAVETLEAYRDNLRRLFNSQADASEVCLDDPDTIDGTQLFEDIGILDAVGRAAQILTGQSLD